VLLEHGLDPAAYQALLADADLLLLPYDAAAYGPRSSGILAEARALGVPAVVPAGCWMEAAAGPGPEVVFHGPADFAAAVERALASLPGLTAALRAAAPEWRRRHSPEALLEALLFTIR
jgi:glycosyltransferase involved in cell wall biosynthesis